MPKDTHDRVITLRLQKSDRPSQIRVVVEYRLEVAEWTVLWKDMDEFRDEVDIEKYRANLMGYYAEFTRLYAPIYADRLIVRVNKGECLELRCTSRKARLVDEDPKNPGEHLRCDLVFESEFDLAAGRKMEVLFQDKTYFNDPGQVIIIPVNETGLAIESTTELSEAERKQAMADRDDDRLRELRVVLLPTPGAPPASTTTPEPQRDRQDVHEERYSLLRLILQSDYGFWLTMLLAALFGAAHALTPGHGKTLVAAYLVGERGTVWHACYLGLVTTLTHTGVVMLIAIVITFLPADLRGDFTRFIATGFGLIMGLIVTCMGFWLLIQRLAGRADHLHLDGGHHHHGPPTQRATVGWWGLTLLGITGGLIPCWDAVGLLCITVGTSIFWIVLPAILAFSAGLAVVLVAIGIAIVQVPRFANARFGGGRVVKALPIVSAILVTLMGLWLCYESAHAW